MSTRDSSEPPAIPDVPSELRGTVLDPAVIALLANEVFRAPPGVPTLPASPVGSVGAVPAAPADPGGVVALVASNAPPTLGALPVTSAALPPGSGAALPTTVPSTVPSSVPSGAPSA